jgi:large conductance mechanosensitive channel
MLKEFKDFIMTGNVVDFAVGVFMAGAIGGVVKGFVDLMIMPIVGHFAGGVDFKDLKYILDEATVDAAGVVAKAENAISYGAWFNTIINLIIVGFVMFLIVKAYNKTKKPVEAAAPAGPSADIVLLTEIRDALKK